MERCWCYDCSDRPDFNDIDASIQKMLHTREASTYVILTEYDDDFYDEVEIEVGEDERMH